MELTPLLQQWKNLKKKYPDVVLFFRLGDFYETLYEDAVLASKVLGITLTKRQQNVPLAGIPYHSIEPYIAKFVKAGYKIAVCEQLEEPKPGKLVKRDVVEVITGGTIVEDTLLSGKENNYIVSIVQNNETIARDNTLYGLALLDLSTGDFKITQLNGEELIEELKKIAPAEIVIPENFPANCKEQISSFTTTNRPSYEFSEDFAKEKICSHFKVASIDGFGYSDSPLALIAAGAILNYIKDTKKRSLPHIATPTHYSILENLILDATTRKNLELIQKIGGERQETLLWVIDHTCTNMGARLLKNYILSPLLNKQKIEARLKKVEELTNSLPILYSCREKLSQIADIERLTTKISMERATPRDMVVLSSTLKHFPEINSLLYEKTKNSQCQENKNKYNENYEQTGNSENEGRGLQSFILPLLDNIISLINTTLVPDPPPTIQPGIICNNVSKELDELRELAHSSKKWISELEASEKKKTGIQSLKIGFNNVFGYYIEVTKPNLKLVPADYIRKQTIANAERFITEKLKIYESKVLSAEERIKRIEHNLFCELRKTIGTEQNLALLQSAGRKIAELDVISTFAYIAQKNKYIKPIITEEKDLIIKDGRHPVVEQILSEGQFVPNPTIMNDEKLMFIITGPNMAGKSTYLRQVALIVIMAQMGSFVPASYAKIGICDRIFTRIGASDDLARGVSTFLAEMSETANILNNATQKSLVLLDEIGRGTSTYDGMSIAWAVGEFLLNKIECKTIFATHYHELTELTTIFSKIKNYQISVKRHENQIIFLRQLVPGGCDDSYGIDVAQLAGIPITVVKRAKELLNSFELSEVKASKLRIKSKQLSLLQ